MFGFLAADSQFVGQPEGTHAVHHPEVDGLGYTALFRGDITDIDTEKQRGSPGMDINTFAECVGKSLVPGHMGQHHQLNLGVIGGYKYISGSTLEGRSDPPAVLIPDGDILQVGFVAG